MAPTVSSGSQHETDELSVAGPGRNPQPQLAANQARRSTGFARSIRRAHDIHHKRSQSKLSRRQYPTQPIIHQPSNPTPTPDNDDFVPYTPPIALHANIVPLATSTTMPGTTGSSLMPGHLPVTEIVLIAGGALVAAAVGVVGVFMIRSLLMRKRLRILGCCRRRQKPKQGIRSSDKGALVANDEFDDATWGTPTRFVYVESINEVTGDDDRHDPVSSLDSSPSAPSMSTWSIHERRGSPGIRDGDGFQERLHVEENDITLALNVALRDVTTETKEDPEKVAEETFFFLGHAENVSSFKSLQANIDSLAKGVSSPSIQNRPRQGSDASASSQETNYPEVVECFSASTSRSSMTSLASTDSEFDEEELEVVYEVKRAHAQSVEIKKGVLVACRPSTSTSNDILIPDVLPTVVISEPSPLLLSLNEQNFGGSMYSLESSLSTGTTASLGGCNTTPSLSSLTREHSHGTLGSFSTSFSTITRAENDEGCLQPPIPYLMVTRPSDSSIFTTESNASGASVDLNEFPLPPKPVKPSYYSRLMDQVHGRKRVWDNHPADSSVSQRRSTVEQFIMMYSST